VTVGSASGPIIRRESSAPFAAGFWKYERNDKENEKVLLSVNLKDFTHQSAPLAGVAPIAASLLFALKRPRMLKYVLVFVTIWIILEIGLAVRFIQNIGYFEPLTLFFLEGGSVKNEG
jgi:hypothetical protein